MIVARFLDHGRLRIGLVDTEACCIHPLDPTITDITDIIKITTVGLSVKPLDGTTIPLREAHLLAPIIPHRNIFCVGKNYHAHAKEFSGSGFEAGAVKGQEIDEYPSIFTKPATAVVGPEDTVELHANVTSCVDYEAELAVVIGKAGRNIAEENAMELVWGYTIINDVTARDRQRNHKQWFAGKSLDTFCPMGPWIVTADEVDETNLDIKCTVNGELRQAANTRDLIFSIPKLIACLSAGMTLQPGDIISTGTPAGVGIGFNPPRFLTPGDRVEIQISGIGELANTFV